MPGRSLRASETGIQKARTALKRKNLTQKAIATEIALAAWATVSKFFNGKAVDRSIFLEICQFLDLDWQEIAENPLEKGETEAGNAAQTGVDSVIAEAIALADDLAIAIQRQATRARTALDPYILPRIRRPTLLEKCLTAIRRGYGEQKRRVVPILGAAGYGKSTILGNIYDELNAELAQSGQGWIALVRCNDFIESVETFATELGEKASGIRESMVEITARLTAQHGRGILLIDTLDLVLDKKLVPVLRGLFFQLLENGATVAFTCRDSDYRDFFEPYHESFAGFTESIERCLVTEFEDEEVKAAAKAFCQQELGSDTPESSLDFAEKIIALSADSKSLAEIVRNPLLLGLMCKLFAQEGNVPEDLTVSQLYQMYWDLKIAQARKYRADSRRVGMAKKNLCLDVASAMYHASDERLRDFVYESQLQLDDIQFLAYEELLSDGVLQPLGANRISFFHQTFLEYAVARWLESTPTGEQTKQQLLQSLIQPQNPYSKHYIWPIIRQLLSLVNLDEFYRIFDQLHPQELSPFRAVAFSAVSRTEPKSSSVLHSLLEVALQKGDAYQDVLLVAASGTPTRHAETVWSIVLALLGQTGQTLVNKAADIAGELMARLETTTSNRIEQAFLAISQRSVAEGVEPSETTANVFGKLIGAYAKTPKTWGRGIDTHVLRALKERYFSFGSHTRAVVLQLYLTPGIPQSVQRELLMHIIASRTSDQFKEKDKLVELLDCLLPGLIESGDSPFGSSWLEALHAPLPKGWDLVQAAAVGHRAALDPDLMAMLIHELFKENLSQEDGQRLRRHHMALGEAIKNGVGDGVARALLNLAIVSVPPNRLSTISALIRELTTQVDESRKVSPELCLSLATWIVPKVSSHPLEFIPILDALASIEPQVQQGLGQALEQVIPQLSQSQVNLIVKKLKHVPDSLEAYLLSTRNYKESRIALVNFYQYQAKHSQSESAVKSLLDFCLDGSREVALDASSVLLNLAEQPLLLKGSDFIPILAKAKILGVRHNGLKALIKQVESGGLVTDSDLVSICVILETESVPEIVQPLYKLIECWVQKHGSLSDALAEATFDLTERLISRCQGKMLDGGIAQSAFVALKNLANLEDRRLSSRLGLCVRKLLRSTDVRAVNTLFVIGLLDKVAKFDESFLVQIVREDCISDGKILPVANLCAIVIAIVHSQGKYASLLDEILADERFPQEVKSRILRERDS